MSNKHQRQSDFVGRAKTKRFNSGPEFEHDIKEVRDENSLTEVQNDLYKQVAQNDTLRVF